MDCIKDYKGHEATLYERTIGNVLFSVLFGPVALFYWLRG